jgi:death-on-curing family protein
MLNLEPEVESEYQRVLMGMHDPSAHVVPHALSVREVLRAHFLIVNHFYLEGEGLGGIGPKDLGLLHSAVNRQYVSFGNKSKWTDGFDICATLFYGLIKNHAFHDANKRTAFLSALFQLQKFGWCPSINEKEFEDFTVEVANNALGKYARYKDLKKSGDLDSEVKFISWYLKKNTRRIDKNNYTITYRELQVILNAHGFNLANPNGNYIDIFRIEKRRPFLGFLGREKEIQVRIRQIGFPRWTAEVDKGTLKTVRDVTQLTATNGVDSAVFFKGLDSMQTLITTYHQPLLRLAQR